MALAHKRVCLITASWTSEDLARHTCADNSHIHLSHSQVWQLESDGLIEWVHRPVNRRDKGIVRLCRLMPSRGLSCRVGAELAKAVRRRQPWAAAMLADITLMPASGMK